MYRVGLDIGGTFSDLTVSDERSRITEFKSLTTADTVGSVASCLDKAATHFGRPLEDFLGEVELFCFGSTHALNTLLTESGSPVGIVTTKGHGDAYVIAEMKRGGYHDIREASERAFSPLVPSGRIVEVPERVDYSGRVVVPLDEDATAAAVRRLVEEEKAEALVVSFLWSQREPAHERRAGEIAEELYPDLHLTLGSEISGALGEFTRLATGVINAYVGKRVQEQADALSELLNGRGLRVPILVMQTVGGVAPLAEVVRRPVMLLNSGPAGGTVAAAAMSRELAEDDVVCIDMGGTSLDVSRLVDGEMQLNRGFSMRGHPVAVAGVDVSSIGAGGGSIAVVEQAGEIARLRVGPESAASSPGPACYGAGGADATVTDANLVLGIVNPAVSLGGEISLSLEAAREAIDRQVATPLGQSVEEASWGIYQVVTAQMADAIEDLLISGGVDPRRFALMAFGAAGPAHASAIARRIGIERVVVPAFFPVFSAFGLMMTDIRHAYHLTDDTVRIAVGANGGEGLDGQADYVAGKLSEVAQLPLALLEEEMVPPERRRVSLFLDMRYSGQELQLPVDVPAEVAERGELSGAELAGLVEEWKRKYVRVYGEGAVWSEGHIEAINYRAVGTGALESPSIVAAEVAGQGGPVGRRRIYLGAWHDADVYRAGSLAPGRAVEGPAVIESELTTVLLGPGDCATADSLGNLNLSPATAWAEPAAVSEEAAHA